MSACAVALRWRAFSRCSRPQTTVSATFRCIRYLSSDASSASISATRSQARNVLIVNKLRTQPVVEAINSLLAHIRDKYPNTRVFHENRPDIPQGVKKWEPGRTDTEPIDLVITLGGDGTILHASSLFKKGAVPPVLSFSMGTLGFLLPFHIDDFAPALESAFANKATVLFRMRLSCLFQDRDGKLLSSHPPTAPFTSFSSESFDSSYSIEDDTDAWQVMNEVALHRGPSPHLTTIETFVDDQHLTESISDGLIVATPTGSTAYSLSAGGPIVHPGLSALVLTPICPRSLSFRPLVFPGTSRIRLRIGDRSRASAAVSMDGQEARTLHPGESVTISASPFPIPCINRSSIVEPAFTRGEDEEGAGPGNEDDWVRDINSLLQYNATFRSKALLRYQR
ncbi:POS5 [Sanghuangporus weigelae]